MNPASITLKIKGKGTQNIFNCNYNRNNYPISVSLNEIKQNKVEVKYNFNKTDNYVELFLENNNIECYYIFKSFQKIYEILILILRKLN